MRLVREHGGTTMRKNCKLRRKLQDIEKIDALIHRLPEAFNWVMREKARKQRQMK